MQSNNRRIIKLGIRVAVFVIVGLTGWGLTRTPFSQALQWPAVIVVCPEGPLLGCQFSKIQDAINAAPDGSSATGYVPPTEIIVAPGTYEENLVILKSVILKGADRDKVILRAKATGGRETRAVILVVGSVVPLTVQISGFTIQETSGRRGAEGIHIIGNGVGTLIYNNRFQNSEGGIIVTYSARVSIRDNLFERGEFGGSGILISDAAKLEITGNTFLNLDKDYGAAAGISIVGSRGRSPKGSEIIVTQNTLRNNQGYGIVVRDSAGVKIRQNTIENAGGIDILFGSEAIEVENNISRRNGSGIYISGSSVLLQGNRLEENQGDGIQISDDATASAVQVLENQIHRNGEFGIWAERLEYVTVCRGNQISENKAGDYGSGTITEPQPSPELKQKCEGG